MFLLGRRCASLPRRSAGKFRRLIGGTPPSPRAWAAHPRPLPPFSSDPLRQSTNTSVEGESRPILTAMSTRWFWHGEKPSIRLELTAAGRSEEIKRYARSPSTLAFYYQLENVVPGGNTDGHILRPRLIDARTERRHLYAVEVHTCVCRSDCESQFVLAVRGSVPERPPVLARVLARGCSRTKPRRCA
jgi:hypothetical protein